MKGFIIEYPSRVTGKIRRSIETGESEAEVMKKWFGDKGPPAGTTITAFDDAKKHYGNTEELSLDQGLLLKLEMNRDGANAHTVNKAAHYYRIAHQKKAWQFMASLENEIRAALVTNDFKGLQQHIMYLF